MRIFCFTLLLLTVSAFADPVKINITSVNLQPPAGFQKTGNDGKFDFYQRSDGAGFRIAILPHGMASGDNTAFLWVALTSQAPFSEAITLALRASICLDNHCAHNVLIGGQVEFSTDGMRWKLPPPATTITATDGTHINLSFVTNPPGAQRGVGWTGTIDLGAKGSLPPTIFGDPTPVPEPLTLVLLGTGLAGLAALGRKKEASR